LKTGSNSVGHPIDVATGVDYSDYEDITISGKVNLTWERCYSTALLDTPPSPLGPGWTNRYFSTLTHEDDKFLFVTSEGDLEVFDNADGTIEQGGVIRNLGSFLELTKRGDSYVITEWNVASGDIKRYVFKGGPKGKAMPLACIEDVTGHGLDILHDEAGRPTSIKQRLEQRTLLIDYNLSNRVSSVSFLLPDNKTQVMARYEYDDKGRLTAAYDALGYVDRYEYNEKSLITREIVKNGGVFFFMYDNRGRCIRTSGLDNYDEKTLLYQDAGWTEVTNSLGYTKHYQWLPSGQVITEIGPAGGTERTEYDDYGRIIAYIDPNGAKTSYEYDDKGNRSKIITPLNMVAEIVYNRDHQAVKMTDLAGNTWVRSYDEYGRWNATEDPLGNRWQFSYDAYGNMIKIIDPNNDVKRFEYSQYGELIKETDWLGNITHYVFDHLHRVIKRTDCEGNSTHIEYDLMNNPIRITFPDKSSIQCSYDSAGNITSIIDPIERRTRYNYGPCGRLLERIDAYGNCITYNWGTEPGLLLFIENEIKEKYRFEYDAAERIVREVSFDNRKLEYEYDAAGNCLATVNGCDERITYKYDDAKRLIQKLFPDGSSVDFAYNAVGNIISAKNKSIDIKLERDPIGRILKETQGDYRVEHVYDKAGNTINTKTDIGHEINYQYNGNGYCTSLQTNSDYSINSEINALGSETKRRLPGNIELNQKYDSKGQLLEQKLAKPKYLTPTPGRLTDDDAFIPPIIKRNYNYDNSGNITKIADNKWGEVNYIYDRVDHLIKTVTENSFEEFTYDPCGNIISRIQSYNNVTKSENSKYGLGNRLLRKGNIKYVYDDNGRLIRKIEFFGTHSPKEWSFRWDYEDQLISVVRPDGGTWNYEYDPFGRRITKKKVVGSGEDSINNKERTVFVWNGDVIIHQINNDKLITTWIFEPYTFIPVAKVNGDSFYSIITNHLGIPCELVDKQGKIVWQALLKPWGEIDTVSVNQTDCPIRFQGQWYDDETGLHYNRFRYYDPEVGQYVSQDPIGLLGGIPLYAYVPNPISWIDELGLIKAPAKLPAKPGIYVLTSDSQNIGYVGQAVDMNDRVSQTGHGNAQTLLEADDVRVQYVEVDLGTATTLAEKRHVLARFEQGEYERLLDKGYTMLNHPNSPPESMKNSKKKNRNLAEIKKHKAKKGNRKTAKSPPKKKGC